MSDEVLPCLCRERGADDLHGPADVSATTSSLCSIKIQNNSAFLVPAYPGCPEKEAIKRQ